MIKRYNDFLNEKLSDKLSGFDSDEITNRFLTGKLDIYVYLNVCRINKLKFPSTDELIKYFNTYGKLNNGLNFMNIIKFNNIDLIKYFVKKHDFNVNINNGYPLKYAIIYNDLEIIEYLVEHGANIKQEHFDSAINLYNNDNVIIYLIKHCNDIELLNSILMQIVCFKNLEVLKVAVEQGADITSDNRLLYPAIKTEKSIDIVKYLVEHGADIHYTNECALIKAISEKFLEIVKYLVEHGADIYVLNNSPIKKAIKVGDLEIIKYLLEVGNYNCLDELLEQVYNTKNKSFISNNIIRLLIEFGAKGKGEIKKYIDTL